MKSQVFTVLLSMFKLLTAKPIVDNTLENLKTRCLQLKNGGLPPKMSIILVGNNPASLIYIKNKKRLCQKIGANFELIQLDESITSKKFLSVVDKVNSDSETTGCFVQLPIPKQLHYLDTSTLISPEKDIDGFHQNSSIDLYFNKEKSFTPCTPKGIIKLLNHYKIKIPGKHIVIVGRSYIVGKPLSLLLSNLNATVTLCHSKTVNLKTHTRSADIIISATGMAQFLDETFVKDDKKQIIIDVGMNKAPNKEICGDVDFHKVKDKVFAITPVPGGVGPLTVLSLLENLIIATEKLSKKDKS